MTPKIVTRLANIAAKLAGSDKYDPTIEPVTAFEYYLNKGVDKILAIKGVPTVEAEDAGKVLKATQNGAKWEMSGVKNFTLHFLSAQNWDDAIYEPLSPEDIDTAKALSDALKQGFMCSVFVQVAPYNIDCLSFTSFFFIKPNNTIISQIRYGGAYSDDSLGIYQMEMSENGEEGLLRYNEV